MTDDRWIAPALAANPSVPDDLLIAMAATNDRQLQLDLIAARRYTPMSLPVATVLADSAHARVRQELACCLISDELLVRLAGDPDPQVRLWIVVRPQEVLNRLPYYVPEAAYAVLARDDDPMVQGELLTSPEAPEQLKRAVARRAHPQLRDRAILRFGADDEATGTYHRLLAHPDADVRRQALRTERFRPPSDLVPQLLADPDVRLAAVPVVPLTPELAHTLVTDPDPQVRRAVAGNPDLPHDLVGRLARDSDPGVTAALLNRSHLPIEFVNGIDDTRDRQLRTYPVEWLWEHRDDVELLDRYSRARHVRYRRTVAGIPGLAPETVRRLATDEDFAVRLLLAEHNPERVPVELLVEMVRTWSGRSAVAMVRNPRFPAEVVDQLVRSDDSSHRWLAYLSDRLTEAQLALLADDPDPALAARLDPPATPSRAEFEARLADPSPLPGHDPHPGHPTVRETAARHRQLPVELMWELWRRAELAAASDLSGAGVEQPSLVEKATPAGSTS
ncbi:hypothetical protein [Plantactinospora endophytica]|uniref:hypothetical protein n=1 Tax=Plantactinospora endophytica TaxID=673535 RepID=UPI001941ABF7|nr:hypothetical protein [Plantactinospora endophytica]